MENKNKELIKTMSSNFWNKCDINAFEEFFSEDLMVYLESEDKNSNEYKAMCQGVMVGFPDMYVSIDNLIAEADLVTKVWTTNSTHKGEFMGIPPTGNKVSVKGMEVFRIKDGKIVEMWWVMDNLGLLQQIGAIPPMG
jgi:steroid delta-isomerase-like uncharacterized protein